jgi:deoxyribodipyrimidine photo-lyase
VILVTHFARTQRGVFLKDNVTAIVWFRQDLRIADQPALTAGAKHQRLVPLYIWAPEEDGEWAPGAASKWWLHDSLKGLHASLKSAGSGLVLRQGDSLSEIMSVIKATGAKAVYCNLLYEPAAIKRDDNIRKALAKNGIHFETFNGSLLSKPASILNQSGTPYLVYGAYFRKLLTIQFEPVLTTIRELPPLPTGLSSIPLTSLNLKPNISWDKGIKKFWRVGEEAASKILSDFCDANIDSYSKNRDIPSCAGTSRLGPHLHFGEVSPRQVWAAARKCKGAGAATYCKQIAWREFSYYLLYHYPRLATEPLRTEFKNFSWQGTKRQLKSWQQGLTGYPIVDAGMRELWHTGYMHNRVRMIVASFLVKDLRIHWLDGARWFWDTLVDADLANNTQGWQWTSGCGADASPFFRVFNPALQGRKFDPDGMYVRQWVPELANIPNNQIHSPFDYGSVPNYPKPIVDHGVARMAALKAYAEIKKKKKEAAQ